MQNKVFILRIKLLIIILATLFFIPYLGTVHLFDWDEINFAEASREMLETGDYLTVRIDYQPFHEKPPFFFWMQIVSMKIFGVNEFAARFPNAIIGIISLLVIFSIGNKLFDYKFGLLWVIAYLGSFLPHFYFKTGIIDPTFNLFIFVGIYFLFQFSFKTSIEKIESSKCFKDLFFASVFITLAILTKGPVGYLLAAIVWICYELFNKNISKFPYIPFLQFTAMTAVIPIIWYLIVFLTNGNGVLEEFILYHIRLLTKEDAGHGGPIYYHIVILLLGCFPASIIMLRGFRSYIQNNLLQKNIRLMMIVLLSVVVIIFSIVNTKIVHYSSLTYFPITFLATLAIYNISFLELSWKKSTTWLLSIFGFFWAFALTLLPILLINSDAILPYITDEMTKEILQVDVKWIGTEWLIGALYFAGLILSVYLIFKKKFMEGIITIYTTTAFVILIILPLLVPNIEKQVQGAPIEFYEEQISKDSYIYTLGFKSYAHYFYSKKPYYLSAKKKEIPTDIFENWLLTGNIDKAAYFVCKINNYKEYMDKYDLTFLYTKGGFVFLKREPE